MGKTIKKKRDFTEGKILKKLILFAIPLALASLVQKLFHAADVAISGKTSARKSRIAYIELSARA